MSARDLHVVWGVNRWVLVETRYTSLERQVTTKSDFVELLTQVGLVPEDATAAADEHWTRRPRDAGTTAARPGEGARRATGLSPGTIALLIGLFIALFIVWVVVIRPAMHP